MSAYGLSAETLRKMLDEATAKERDRCIKIVNEARFNGLVDLREIRARIADSNYQPED